MKHNLVLSILFVSCMLALSTTKADLLDCTEEKLKPVSDFSGIGPEIGDDTSVEKTRKWRDFLKSISCQIKKRVSKVNELLKKIGSGLKTKAKEWGKKVKDLGSKIKTKFHDLIQKFGRRNTKESKKE